MNIEYNIFKRSFVNISKLVEYGFKKENNKYVFEKIFLDDFKAIVVIDEKCVNGKVIDINSHEEYTNIRTSMCGKFVNKVREEYKNILIDIRNNCFTNLYFISNQANRITQYIIDTYGDEPEFLWTKSSGHGVFRNKKNNKWYGIIMNIDSKKLDKDSGEVEVLNVKLEKDKIVKLLQKDGYYPAYHMNKKSWISILLNDSIADVEIIELVNESFKLTDM